MEQKYKWGVKYEKAFSHIRTGTLLVAFSIGIPNKNAHRGHTAKMNEAFRLDWVIHIQSWRTASPGQLLLTIATWECWSWLTRRLIFKEKSEIQPANAKPPKNLTTVLLQMLCGPNIILFSGHRFATPTVQQRASLIAQLVKNPPTMQETPIQFLGQEVPLEKG